MRKHLITTIIALSALTATAQQKQPKEPFLKEEWTRDYKPFRIAGNLYYVGTYDLGCYLIATPEGHILINTGVAASGPMLRQHIEELGFKMSDIKIILISQVHYDHVGTLAEIQQLTGAQVMVDEKDAAVLADGGASDYLYSDLAPLFTPVKADRLLRNGDKIKLGGTEITMLHHPGHTKGSCSFAFTVADKMKQYKVLIANMPSVIVDDKLEEVKKYPAITADYQYTFKSLRAQKFDLWLAAHASQFNLQLKHPEGAPYNPEAFRDPKGYKETLDELEKGFKEKQ